MTRQRLNERQSCWAEELSRYSFRIQYRPGREATAPNRLFRREQDIPKGFDDERELGRYIQLIPDEAIPDETITQIGRTKVLTRRDYELPPMRVFEE